MKENENKIVKTNDNNEVIILDQFKTYTIEQVKNAMCRLLNQALRDKSLGGMSTYYPYVNKWIEENL